MLVSRVSNSKKPHTSHQFDLSTRESEEQESESLDCSGALKYLKHITLESLDVGKFILLFTFLRPANM